MAVHIDDFAADVALILKNLSQGIKDGQTCGMVIQSSETAVQISGEIVFDGEIIQQVTENDSKYDKLVTDTSPKQVSQVGSHAYNEQVDDGGTVSGSIGVDQSVTRNFISTTTGGES